MKKVVAACSGREGPEEHENDNDRGGAQEDGRIHARKDALNQVSQT
ncbi:MAG: hypothetical protein U5O39_06610 [Gammaproteobacteria bacterium]|nr:hypothetical protein [Gammaproteobacteria bacterium]